MSDQALVDDPTLETDQSEDEARTQTQIAKRTEKFRRQHDVLLNLATELDGRSTSIHSLEDAKVIRTQLNHFAGKLVVHLAKEDKSLYPKLLESSDAQVVSLTRRFIREMGDLSSAFEAFTKRWVNPTDIFEQRAEFQSEMAGIISALATRIDKENNELYTLADSLTES